MNSKVISIFYPKLDEQKAKTTPKLNRSEKMKLSNVNYIDVLTQIQSKKRELNDVDLCERLFSNQKEKQNILRFKLFNKNERIKTALITEPNRVKNNIGKYRDLSNNFKVTNSYAKTRSINSKYLTTPKKLINKIIKFEEEKKEVKRIKLVKKREPMELSNCYKDFIKKMNELNFSKYFGSPTDYAHNIRSLYFIDSVKENLKNEAKKNKLYLLKEKEKIEDEKESRDTVFYPSIELQKISKKIKLILTSQTKLNQFSEHITFFDDFANRINFLFDNYKPPHIKNNLARITYQDMKNEQKLSLINRVGGSAINYLSYAKIKLQKEKDEKKIFLFEKNKIKKKYNYYKKLSISNIYNSKEEIEKLIYKNYYMKDENDYNYLFPRNDSLTFEEVIEFKNYFENKIRKYNNIVFADKRSRHFVFDNQYNDFFNSKKKDKDYLEIL